VNPREFEVDDVSRIQDAIDAILTFAPIVIVGGVDATSSVLTGDSAG
jgi:hypothetical protein